MIWIYLVETDRLHRPPRPATCEIDTFRYRVLHVAARITRAARQIRLRIDATGRWATAISQAWQRTPAALPLIGQHHRPIDPRKPHRPGNARRRATPADLPYPSNKIRTQPLAQAPASTTPTGPPCKCEA